MVTETGSKAVFGCKTIILRNSGHDEQFTARILILSMRLNIQVISDPYDIKMGDPRAGESVADYDKYVFT